MRYGISVLVMLCLSGLTSSATPFDGSKTTGFINGSTTIFTNAPPIVSTTPWISSPTVTDTGSPNPRVQATQIIIGSTNRVVTQLAFYNISGATGGIHRVGICDSGGNVLTFASVDTAGQPSGYVIAACSPITLTSGVTYFVASEETSAANNQSPLDPTSPPNVGILNTSIATANGTWLATSWSSSMTFTAFFGTPFIYPSSNFYSN